MSIEQIKRDVAKLNYEIIDNTIDLITEKFEMVFGVEPGEITMIDSTKGYIEILNDIFILCDSRSVWVEFSVHKAKDGYDPKYRIVKTYDDLLLAIQNKINTPMYNEIRPKSLNDILNDIEAYLASEPESFNPYGDFDKEVNGYKKRSFKMWHEPYAGKEGDREAIYYEFKTVDGLRYGMGKEVSLGGHTIDRELCAKLSKLHLEKENQL